MKLLEELKKFSKVVGTLAGDDEPSLDDTPVTIPSIGQAFASTMEPDIGIAPQESEGPRQRHSSTARRSRLNDIHFVDLVQREGTRIYGTEDQDLDTLCFLVETCTFGTSYNNRFSDLLETAEIVFLGRFYIYKALKTERKTNEMTKLYQNLVPFGLLLKNMHSLFSSCALNLAPNGKRVKISPKKVEKSIQELNSKLDGFILELNGSVLWLNDDFCIILNSYLAQATTSCTPKQEILVHVVRTLQNSHSGLQPTSSQAAILNGDIVAEPEGRVPTFLEPAPPRRGQGGAIQIMDRPLVDEPLRRQSTMQLSPSAPKTTSAATSHATFQHNPSDTRSANRRVSSQHESQNHRSTEARRTTDDESRRPDISRAPKSSKRATADEHPAEETRTRCRCDTNNTTSHGATNERTPTRKSSRKASYVEDLGDAPAERRREKGGDRPRRSSSGMTSNYDARRRHRPRDSSIKEETEGPTEESSSEDDRKRRNSKKKSTHDRERRHRDSDYHRDHDRHMHPPFPEPYRSSTSLPGTSSQALELVAGMVRAHSNYAPSYPQNPYGGYYHR
ncbi:hypothetical protein BJ165DRAFT_152664 [Panaeolus papilionaceus]|nr:hypothetical protein BJ165DRAFT_152664 [Panaeolus papilionaceus]